jgi:hypothetical protein
MFNAMTPVEQGLFLALHWQTASLDPRIINSSIMETNCFSNVHTDQNGQKVTTIIVHNNISRANHSCRPNAVYAYDHLQNRGTLRALKAILANQEIFVEYLPTEEDSLKSGHDRREELNRHYGFNCDCDACGDPNLGANQRNRQDDDRRNTAATNHAAISANVIPAGGLDQRSRSNHMRPANDYIRNLKALGITDYRLAGAFMDRAKVHKALYVNAASLVAARTHCDICRKADSSWQHLYDAHSDYFLAEVIDGICYGPNHPKGAEVLARKQEIVQLLIRLGASIPTG